MIRRFIEFCVSRNGNVTITAALFIPVLVGMTAFNVELISYDRGQIRLHQAQMAAVQAVSKEGRLEADSVAALPTIASTYVDANMAALGSEDESHFNNLQVTVTASGKNTSIVNAQAEFASWFMPVGGRVFPKVDQDVKAKHYFRKMETVLVLDASSSMNKKIGDIDQFMLYRDAVMNYINAAFDEQEEGGYNHRISLLSYSRYINLNQKYKDKLVTNDSRRWKSKYPHLQTVANEHGWGGGDDLLSEFGPEGYRGGAAVRRKRIEEFGTDPYTYVEAADHPPATNNDGFELVMIEGGNESIVPNESNPYQQGIVVLDKYEQINSLRDRTVTTIQPDLGLQVPRAEMNLYPLATKEWFRHHLGRAIMVQNDAGPMPMLVHSDNREELLKNMEFFTPCISTGSDEGVMWALRILSPNWSGIWEITDLDGDPVPAPYHGDSDKRIIILSDGDDNEGHYRTWNKRDEDNVTENFRNIFPALGEYIRERGIELLYSRYDYNSSTLGYYAKDTVPYIVDTASDNFFSAKGAAGAEEFLEKMKQWGNRRYHVRVAE